MITFGVEPSSVCWDSSVIVTAAMPSFPTKPTASPAPPGTTVKPVSVSGVRSKGFSALAACSVTARGKIVIVETSSTVP